MPGLWGIRASCFNPRLRVGGDAMEMSSASSMAMFQSTPPRGRRPPDALRIRTLSSVSIHASAWEATVQGTARADRILVSIHASAWEATGSIIAGICFFLFQSTPPRGRRQMTR